MSTKQVDAGSLKKGNTIVFDGKACTIRDIQIGKSGKHGHAKARIEAVTLFGNQKIIKVLPGGDKVEVPLIEKKSAQVLSGNGDKANVMDLESYETFDLKITDELKDQVKEGMQIVYWIVLDEKVMMQVKVS
ncbi:translation initiation factor IF-5A [Candidatus Woesearchaeota archaeon]|nr:translation initiation factor IF-5A [Candidatus Woesearchaeota archaeon]